MPHPGRRISGTFGENIDGRTIRGNDFRDRSHQRKLPDPTDAIRDKYGADTIMRARAMGSRKNIGRKQWNVFMDGLEDFTNDIFDGGLDQGVQEERGPLT